MSYRIQYNKTKHPWEQRVKHRKMVLITFSVCVALLLIGYLGIQNLHFLLPGDPEVTADALEAMTQSLQEGEPLGEAVLAFCREVLENADMPQ